MGAAIVLATRNEHKLREFRELLSPLVLDALPVTIELPAETGTTYAQNALAKARTAARATGGAALGHDSGIESEALGGAPGVRSARFAGEGASDEENLAKLIELAPAGSRLTYVCVLAYVDDRNEHLFEGRCEGHRAARPRGIGGFGYDPAFVPVDIGERTMAELSSAEKHAISHRGAAARAFMAWRDD